MSKNEDVIAELTDVMSPRAQQLLFHIERRAVENGGLIDTTLISMDDEVLLDQWNRVGFVEYGNVFRPAEGTTAIGRYCILSQRAWELAAGLRRKLARKNYANRDWLTEADAKKYYEAMNSL